jgi:hypothetical protein
MRLIAPPEKISKTALQKMAESMFGNLVKAVVDVERGLMAVGGELHADEETLLLEAGSKPQHLWGINLYPKKDEQEWIEFDSVVNLKPALGHRSQGVDDPTIRQQIVTIVKQLVE